MVHRPGRGIFDLFGALSQAQAQSCLSIYETIKQAAMYCGFFCDQDRLLPLQKSYETKCISLVVPPSPFDLDTVPQEITLLGRRSLHGGEDYSAR